MGASEFTVESAGKTALEAFNAAAPEWQTGFHPTRNPSEARKQAAKLAAEHPGYETRVGVYVHVRVLGPTKRSRWMREHAKEK